MDRLRRLLCALLGHETFTVAMPMPDGSHLEVLECCLRCDHTRALVDLTD